MSSTRVTVRSLPVGTRVSRGVAAGQPWSGWKGARTVAPHSSTDAGHRFGGPRPAPPAGPRDGAWYGALSRGPGRGTPGLLLERQWYYAKEFDEGRPIPLAVLQAMDAGALNWAEIMQGRLLVDYQLRTAIHVVDLSWEKRRGLFATPPSPSLQHALAAKGFQGVEQAFSSEDYTVCRAVAHYVRDRFPDVAGLICESMRETRAGSGQNLVLFGADGEELEVLQPLTEWQVTEVAGEDGKPTIRARQVTEAPHPSPVAKGFAGR